MTEARHLFTEHLQELEDQALGGLDLVLSSLDRTLEALDQHDTELANIVITDDDRIDGRYLEVHQGILTLLALQSPVATDLRLVAALLHLIKHIERMGDQCVNIAKLIPLSGHEPSEDEELHGMIDRMGTIARSMVAQSKRAFELRDPELSHDLVRQDDELDRLNRQIFIRALDIGDEVEVREWAMFMILTARCLERIGDNAVDVGEQATFVATGLFREFDDASHQDRTAST